MYKYKKPIRGRFSKPLYLTNDKTLLNSFSMEMLSYNFIQYSTLILWEEKHIMIIRTKICQKLKRMFLETLNAKKN